MSIKVMSNVWELSKQKNSALLLMLALADHANDDGVCWPSVARLATRIRRTERHTKRLLVKLEAEGEVYHLGGIGRGNTNRYLVTVGFTAEELLTVLVRRFELTSSDAQAVVDAIMTTGKGDTGVTITGAEKVTSRAQKGDISGEKVTFLTGKGDIAMSPEPSCNHHENRQEPSDSASTPRDPPPKKRKQTKTSTPAAVKVFRANAHRYPAKSWYDEVAGAVGEEPDELERWGKVVKAWVGVGWKPTNVSGMLDFFKRNEIPPGNGRHAPHQQSDSRIVAKPPAQPVDPEQTERDRRALQEHRARRGNG